MSFIILYNKKKILILFLNIKSLKRVNKKSNEKK